MYRFRPLELRLSRSDSYRTPQFGDLFSTRNPSVFNSIYDDPYAPGGPARVQVVPTDFISANLDLKPETSVNWTASATWAPEAVPGLRFKATWSDILFSDQITFGSTLLYNHAEVAFNIPEIVQRDDQGNAVRIRNASINIAEKVSEVLRFEAAYQFDTEFGLFLTDFQLNMTQEEFFKVTPASDPVDRVGTSGGTDEWNFTGRLTFIRDRITANVDAKYQPPYDNTNTGRCLEVVGRCERLFSNRPSLEVDGRVCRERQHRLRVRYGLEGQVRRPKHLRGEIPNRLRRCRVRLRPNSLRRQGTRLLLGVAGTRGRTTNRLSSLGQGLGLGYLGALGRRSQGARRTRGSVGPGTSVVRVSYPG